MLDSPPTAVAPRPVRASRQELWLVGALLLVVAAVVYGPHVLEGGFTLDDYGHAAGVQHPREGILQDYWTVFPHRPGLALYIPVPHVLLGPHPAPHLALATLHAVLMSLALYAVLRRLTIPSLHAGAVAVLVLLFPWSDSATFWAVAGHISMAIALGLAGLLLALRGLDTRAAGSPRKALWLHVGAVALYATSVLTYEIAGGALLLAGASYTMRAPWSVAWRRWAADAIVIVPCLAWTGLRADRAGSSLAEMSDHANSIADSGLTVLSLAAVPFSNAGRDVIFAGGYTNQDVVLSALVTVAILGLLAYRFLPTGDDARPELRRWLLMASAGVAVSVAAWALYIPADPYYNPGAEGVGNRVNVMAGIGIVAIVYSLVALSATLLRRCLSTGGRAATVACAVFAAVLAISYARDERDEQQAWARADTAADGVVGAITTVVPEPPPYSTIYTFGHPGSERAGIPIFSASWDLKGAVQLKYNDPTLNAYPILQGTELSCADAGLGPLGNGLSPNANGAPYQHTYFVDVGTWTGERINTQRQCETALDRYIPGPVIRTP